MADVIIPNAGESVTSANIAQWHIENGSFVEKGQVLVTLETDKVSQEVEAEQAGVLTILVEEGEEVAIGAVIANIAEGEREATATASVVPAATSTEDTTEENEATSTATGETLEVVVPAAGESVTSANVAAWNFSSGDAVNKGDVLVTLETDKVSQEVEAEQAGVLQIITEEGEEVGIGTVIATIAVGAAAAPAASTIPEVGIAPAKTVAAPSSTPAATPAPSTPAPSTPASSNAPTGKVKPDLSITPDSSERGVKAQAVTEGRTTRKKMTMLRRKIASHLTNAQQTAAILTTFNEVDMSAIMNLRKQVQEDFVKKYDTKLGFMSFFVKACVQALKDVPEVNGMIEGNDIIQNNYYDISVAIGTEKGLVVPVLRDPDAKGFAEIEKDIIAYAMKAREGKITLEDLTGGVFTISNGGVYGSLLSTPIINPPQSAILGMHTIQQRPVAIDGQVVIRPMMNLALSYDHRLIDGKEAVTFLIRIKDCLENPSRLMLEM